jgi:hypothetical protein
MKQNDSQEADDQAAVEAIAVHDGEADTDLDAVPVVPSARKSILIKQYINALCASMNKNNYLLQHRP